MFSPFPEEKAKKEIDHVLELLKNGDLVLEKTGNVSLERSENGLMLGCLVSHDKDGKIFVLRTLSGISNRLVSKRKAGNSAFCENAETVFVEPLAGSEEIENALSENDREIHLLTEYLNKKKDTEMLERRKKLCASSLEKVYALYSFYCFDGKKRSLMDLCKKRGLKGLPPTGTGDCCAPKLLNYAFKNSLTIESMCEVFLGKGNKHKVNGFSYPPCDERCGIILPSMLGLEILYRDKDILLVNKESGLLSVPGRGPEKSDCVEKRMKILFPDTPSQPAVHRLDMETSGIMILAFNAEAHRKLVRQFEERQVQKEYIALVDGVLPAKKIPSHGQNELYFRLDIDNRPHQIWDEINGKKAVTEWDIVDVENYLSPSGKVRPVTRVLFKPHTGRTHQLRLASSDSHGFSCPIVGDTLYGKCEEGERLMLHAQRIVFFHPEDGRKMDFFCKAPF